MTICTLLKLTVRRRIVCSKTERNRERILVKKKEQKL